MTTIVVVVVVVAVNLLYVAIDTDRPSKVMICGSPTDLHSL